MFVLIFKISTGGQTIPIYSYLHLNTCCGQWIDYVTPQTKRMINARYFIRMICSTVIMFAIYVSSRIEANHSISGPCHHATLVYEHCV